MLPYNTWVEVGANDVVREAEQAKIVYGDSTTGKVYIIPVDTGISISPSPVELDFGTFVNDVPGGYMTVDMVDGNIYFWQTNDKINGDLWRINTSEESATFIQSISHPLDATVESIFANNGVLYMEEWTGYRSYISRVDFSGTGMDENNWLIVENLAPPFQMTNNDFYYKDPNGHVRRLNIPLFTGAVWVPDPYEGALVHTNLTNSSNYYGKNTDYLGASDNDGTWVMIYDASDTLTFEGAVPFTPTAGVCYSPSVDEVIGRSFIFNAKYISLRYTPEIQQINADGSVSKILQKRLVTVLLRDIDKGFLEVENFFFKYNGHTYNLRSLTQNRDNLYVGEFEISEEEGF